MKGSSPKTRLSRRAFVASTFGLGAVAYFLPADDPISKACAAWRACSARFVAIERRYEELAPDLDRAGDVKAMRRLEDAVGREIRARIEAEESILALLDEAGLEGVRDGGEVFIVHDLHPEGVRRLVVVPVGRVRGI